MAATATAPFRLAVRRSDPGKGRGLFLVEGNIPAGAVVARMSDATRVPRSEWKKKRRRTGRPNRVRMWGKILPHDVGVHYEDASGREWVFYDRAFRGRRVKMKNPRDPDDQRVLYAPRWYRLNHSRRHNVTPRATRSATGTGGWDVEWTADRPLRTLARGRAVELTFRYGEVPPAWDED